MSGATPGHDPDRVGDQDLARLRLCAEAGGLDDRIAEEVIGLSGRFAAAEPDA